MPLPSSVQLVSALAVATSLLFASRPARAQDAPASRPDDGGDVHIHVEAEFGARLERRTAPSGWTIECEMPCDRRVPSGGEYRLHLADAPVTRTFHLVAGNEVVIHAEPASQTGLFFGAVLAYTGISAFPLAVTALAVGYGSNDSGIGEVGLVATIASVVAGISGGLLIASNAHSDVTQSTWGSGSAQDSRSPGETEKAARAAPPIFGVPLFSGTF